MAGLLFSGPLLPPPCLRDLALLAWSLLRAWEEEEGAGTLEPPLEEVRGW